MFRYQMLRQNLRFFFLSLSLFLLFSNNALFAQSVEEQGVLTQEARRFSAMTRRDTVALKKMLASDLVYIHSNGLVERGPEHLQSITTDRLHYESMSREEATARLYGKMALVNGIVKAKGLLNGTAFDVRLRYTAVYRRHKKTWELLNWQSTRMP